MRAVLLIAAAFLISSCTATTRFPDGETVAIKKLATDTRGRPYECIGYEVDTDTCEGIAKRTIRGDRIFYDLALIVPGPNFDLIRVNVEADFQIEGNRYCGTMRNAEITAVGELSPSEKSILEEVILAQMLSLGEFCGLYVRDPQGFYSSVTVDRSGRVMPDSVDRVWFFSKPKKLRLSI